MPIPPSAASQARQNAFRGARAYEQSLKVSGGHPYTLLMLFETARADHRTSGVVGSDKVALVRAARVREDNPSSFHR